MSEPAASYRSVRRPHHYICRWCDTTRIVINKAVMCPHCDIPCPVKPECATCDLVTARTDRRALDG